MNNSVCYINQLMNFNKSDAIAIKNERFSYSAPKIDLILEFLKTKFIVHKYNKFIKNNIVKNSKIRNGNAVIKGTRITTKELYFATEEFEKYKSENQELVDFIKEQYPSIETCEQIVMALLYEIKKINTIKYIFMVINEK